MAKEFKKPKAEGKGKLAAPVDPGSTQQLSPVFCLRYLKNGYTLDECGHGEASAFVRKLKQLCDLSWDVINKSAREGQGYEKMPVGQIRGQRPARVTDDVSELHVFRFGDLARIIGLRHGRVFEVYYIDHAGEAYDH